MGDVGEIVGEENRKLEKEVMDTPERSKNNQITTSISTFEDSPVFNFLNSLSPIKPVKSVHISQTINPLSFASLPSVFTSPHVSSLRESRFLQRHQLSDPSNPKFSSDNGNTVHTDRTTMDATDRLDEHNENLDQRLSDCEVAEETFQRGLYRGEERIGQIDQQKEATPSDWESLISDGSDLLIFESPNDTDYYKKSVDPATTFYKSIKNAIQNVQSHGAVASEPENLLTQPGEGSEMMESSENIDVIAGSSIINPGENMEFEHLSGLYRGMRRRCLVFELDGSRRKRSEDDGSGSDSSVLLQSDGNISSNQQLVPINDSSSRALPGIGLHLNAISKTPKNYKIVNHEASASGRLLIGPTSFVDMNPSTSGQDLLTNTRIGDYSLERENGTVENGILNVEDPFQESGCMESEEMNQSSPKKKSRRLEQPQEAEACKRCNCKKSKCLKLYCECFAAGVYCVEPCACIDCFNKPIHEDTVLATRKQIESRNPLAFAPKVIKGSESLSEMDDFSKTPASARHKRGCNCKKSGCLKKYCECYQGGVGCSINCRCEGCKNAFGRKDGSTTSCTDHELEEDETDTNEKIDEQNNDSAPPATPLRTGRQLIQPFSSKKKPPRSTFPSTGSSSSGFCTGQGQGFGKSNFFPPTSKFSRHFENVKEGEMPQFLQGGSPVKTSSPNRKRVSPPNGIEMPSGVRSSRKLILQSISSFPSLTSNQ